MATTEAFDKVTYRGRLMDRKTQAFLKAMEDKLGYPLTVVQGCYNAGAVSASAGTHDGGGVVDLVSWDAKRKVRAARELGAFAWFRPDLPGVWGEHIHLGVRAHGRLSPAAKAQQADFDGAPPRNGLAGKAVDRTWHPDPAVTFKYKTATEPPEPEPTRVARARDALAEAIHDLGEAAALLDAADEDRPVAKNQIDDLHKLRQHAREVLDILPPA
jgi:hypothetical protein